MHRAAWVVLLLTGLAQAQEEPPPPEAWVEMERRLRAQDERIQRLEEELAGRQAEPPPPADAAPVSSTDPASDLLFSAAFGEGFTVRRRDESFSLTLRGRLQVRFTHLDPEGEDPDEQIELRRARITLQGDVLEKLFSYRIQLGMSRLDTEPDSRIVLRDAVIDWNPHRDARLRIGQTKVPFNRQRLISSANQSLVDRSIVQAELNLDRDIGVQLFSEDLFGLDGLLRYTLGVFQGQGRNRVATEEGLLFAARLEVMPLGKFEAYEEADLERLPRPRLALAVAGAYNARATRATGTLGAFFPGDDDVDFRHAAADLIFKWHGLSIQAEALWRDANQSALFDPASGTVTLVRRAWGWFAQAGYAFSEHFELVARVGELQPLGRSAVGHTWELGGGANLYVVGHSLKLQVDYFHFWDRDRSDGDDQVRAQLQLAF